MLTAVAQQIRLALRRRAGVRHSMVIRYLVEGWGDVDDLDKRRDVHLIVDPCLRSAGNGYVDGGDLGSGSINVYLEGVVDPELACTAIVRALRDNGHLDGAHIALEVDDAATGDRTYRILWPTNYEGEFSTV